MRGGGSSSLSRVKRRCRPSHIRYATPAHFTTLKAVAEEATIAESPAAATTPCPSVPSSTPSMETRPAWRPPSTVRATM